MREGQSHLKGNVLVEPLFNQWYAWSYLVSPATAAMYVANQHLNIMRSFVSAPQVHIAALKNPAMLGGPFINYDAGKAPAAGLLLEKTAREQARLQRAAGEPARRSLLRLPDAQGGLHQGARRPRGNIPARAPVNREAMPNSYQRRSLSMMHTALPGALLLAVLLAAPTPNVFAQSAHGAHSPEELSRTLTALDAALFDSYNRCELEKFAAFFAEDIEFYHDKGGLTLSRKSLVESVKNNICGKVRREVVAGSLEAHPIPGFGAMQMGAHRFYEVSAGPNAGPVGVARFISLWQFKDGAWKITRVVSYDHRPATK